MAYSFGVFALILVLSRLRVPLSLAIAAGAVVLGFAFGLTGSQVPLTVFAGAIQPRAIALTVVTVLLLALSGMMQFGGQMTEIVDLVKALLRRPAVAMAALPALIGLLPMPGGAVFSAPMVEAAAGRGNAGGSVLSAFNYWFRHIWEHWWPLYPGVMLAMALSKSSYWALAAYQLPLGVFMAVAGLLLFRGLNPDLHAKAAPAAPGSSRKLLIATSSIWVIVLVWVPMQFIVAWAIVPNLPTAFRHSAGSAITSYAPLIFGLLVSIVWTVLLRHHAWSVVGRIFAGKVPYTMAGLVISVMIFQHMLDQTGAARQIAAELRDLRVPVVLVVAILPFIAGLLVGLAVGFVGVSFPIVVALVETMGAGASMHTYVALAYGFGHLGQMMSPLHLCHVMSNQYFKTTFGPVYRRLLPSALATAVMIVIYFSILRIAHL
ncbi:MAG: DUF401 family protein [Planctomycetes bacterium]|nr:DUF401 family protein [Planctomycetota bacterium]